jgi:hypothetical protein
MSQTRMYLPTCEFPTSASLQEGLKYGYRIKSISSLVVSTITIFQSSHTDV